MLNMSFYNGTLNRPEAADVVRASNKTIYHRMALLIGVRRNAP